MPRRRSVLHDPASVGALSVDEHGRSRGPGGSDAAVSTLPRPERVLVIIAHPDDTDPGRPARSRPGSERGRLRASCAAQRRRRRGRRPRGPLKLAPTRGGATRAATHVGYAEVTFLHRPDGALADDLALREQLVRLIRTVRPTRSWSTRPWSSRATATSAHRPPEAAMAALDAVYPAAGDALAFRPGHPEALEPHAVH